MKNVKENIMRFVFILAACVSIAAVALICIFLFANGIPAIAKIGPLKFLGGTTWNPNQEIFGIFPMIVGQYLRYRNCNNRGSSDWLADLCFSGKILSGKAV